jgi:hypothetical protein
MTKSGLGAAITEWSDVDAQIFRDRIYPANQLNYWWTERNPAIPPADTLLHALLAMRDMPAGEREVWRILFDFYVFKSSGDPLQHLAPELRGLMGAPNIDQYRAIRASLLRSFAGKK